MVAVEPMLASATIRKSCDGSSTALAVEGGDYVPGTEAGRIGLRVPGHLHDEDPPDPDRAYGLRHLRSQLIDDQTADGAAAHFPVLDQVVDDAAREVARHRESDALVAAALAEDAGVDADELAAAC